MYVITEKVEMVGGRQAPVLDAKGRPKTKDGKPITVLTGQVCRRSYELRDQGGKMIDSGPKPGPLKAAARKALRRAAKDPGGGKGSGAKDAGTKGDS